MQDTTKDRATELDQVVPDGRAAYAELVAAIRSGEGSAEAVAEATWDQFRAAVAAVLAEGAAEDAAGIRRWQEARHGSHDEEE